MNDGGLRATFQLYLPDAFWVPVETWSTGQGVPDSHFCFPGGVTGWVENKKTHGWAVGLDKEQSAWLERYARHGGRCFVAVRRLSATGPRKGTAADELWLFRGADARALMLGGLKAPGIKPLGQWGGGPANWDWPMVKGILAAQK